MEVSKREVKSEREMKREENDEKQKISEEGKTDAQVSIRIAEDAKFLRIFSLYQGCKISENILIISSLQTNQRDECSCVQL